MRLRGFDFGFVGASVLQRLPALYLPVCAVLTLWVLTTFFGSMRLQTLHSLVWADPERFDFISQKGVLGELSAPLDDVFIHFDFARSAARGHPFEWIEGNGYSSGGTSLLYPFVLVPGYWLGFEGQGLMAWAGIVASLCVFGTLWLARRLFSSLPQLTAFLLPVAFLSTGVLNWTLFSGMEVAVFLCVWAASFHAWDQLSWSGLGREAALRAAGCLGLCGLLLVATRPEAATCVCLLSISAAWLRRRDGFRHTLAVLAVSATPGALVTLGHALANHLLTGDSASAGAVAKLEVYHPYFTSQQVWDAWWFHTKYQVARVTNYHLADTPPYGGIVWLLAGAAVVFRRTRRNALLLLGLATAWVFTVALNGQVRWQNERYTMPALAWLLMAAALGAGALLTYAVRLWSQRRAYGVLTAAATLGVLVLFAIHQAPRFREQVWFFGRASRNILDQHIQAGLALGHQVRPRPQRVLLSDAGAIVYASGLPAVDLIGLGGYLRLPFARATRHGAGAGLELIERLSPAQRPDVMALYPSWWGTFPLWFGQQIGEVPVRGNVICGGASKVIYRADWSPFDGSGAPLKLSATERVTDSLDLADVISEKSHGFTSSEISYVNMKLLYRGESRVGLWDAGRLVSPGNRVEFSLSGHANDRPLKLSFRVAPPQPVAFRVHVNGKALPALEVLASDHWREPSVEIPAASLSESLHVVVEPVRGAFDLYHVFATQRH